MRCDLTLHNRVRSIASSHPAILHTSFFLIFIYLFSSFIVSISFIFLPLLSLRWTAKKKTKRKIERNSCSTILFFIFRIVLTQCTLLRRCNHSIAKYLVLHKRIILNWSINSPILLLFTVKRKRFCLLLLFLANFPIW